MQIIFLYNLNIHLLSDNKFPSSHCWNKLSVDSLNQFSVYYIIYSRFSFTWSANKQLCPPHTLSMNKIERIKLHLWLCNTIFSQANGNFLPDESFTTDTAFINFCVDLELSKCYISYLLLNLFLSFFEILIWARICNTLWETHSLKMVC